MTIENKTAVLDLINKAKICEKSEDALRFSQAALNAAHALQVLRTTETIK